MPSETIAISGDKRWTIQWGSVGKDHSPEPVLTVWRMGRLPDGRMTNWEPVENLALTSDDVNNLIQALRTARRKAFPSEQCNCGTILTHPTVSSNPLKVKWRTDGSY